MAATNLHIENNYSSYAYFINFIVILDHENMGTDTIFMTLPLILTKIFPKIEFSVMDAIICIYKNSIFNLELYKYVYCDPGP